MRCSLHIVDLRDSPLYDALSVCSSVRPSPSEPLDGRTDGQNLNQQTDGLARIQSDGRPSVGRVTMPNRVNQARWAHRLYHIRHLAMAGPKHRSQPKRKLCTPSDGVQPSVQASGRTASELLDGRTGSWQSVRRLTDSPTD